MPFNDDTLRSNILFGSGSKAPFVNPYTFFPIENVEPERKSRELCGGEGLSGVLQCSLEIAEGSPLFIPNTTGWYELPLGGDKSHKSFEFYSYDDLSESVAGVTDLPSDGAPDTPVIPGSSIRGMARSVYEQLTNSCMLGVDKDNKGAGLRKRSLMPKKPYLMKYDAVEGKWGLYKTNVFYLGKPHDPCGFHFFPAGGAPQEGSAALFSRLNNRSYEEFYIPDEPSSIHIWAKFGIERKYALNLSEGPAVGTRVLLHSTGEMDKKHLTLFCPDCDGSQEPRWLEEGEYEGLYSVVEDYCKVSTVENHNNAIRGYQAYKSRLDSKEPVLVYAIDFDDRDYMLDHLYLAPACIAPEALSTSIYDIVGHQKRHTACNAETGFCPACRLFGAISDGGSIGSRVRFTDAEPDEASIEFGEPTILAPLSEPRVSATEFYLKKPKNRAVWWNHDYYMIKTARNEEGRSVTSFRYLPYLSMDSNCGIQGRKVYLHFPFNQNAHYEPTLLRERTTQNNTVRPLEQGRFRFKVFFEDLTPGELSDLIFAIGGMESSIGDSGFLLGVRDAEGPEEELIAKLNGLGLDSNSLDSLAGWLEGMDSALSGEDLVYKLLEQETILGDKAGDLAEMAERELGNTTSAMLAAAARRLGEVAGDVGEFKALADASKDDLTEAIGSVLCAEGRLQKLGHGKPLGMGSVRVKVTGCQQRAYSLSDGEIKSSYEPIGAAALVRFFLDSKAEVSSDKEKEKRKDRRDLIMCLATDLSTVEAGVGDPGKKLGDLVTYPRVNNAKIGKANAIFDWFKENRGEVNDPSISQFLSSRLPSL